MSIEQYTKNLEQFVAFESVSTDPQFKSEIKKTVDFLLSFLSSSGFSTSLLQAANTNPVVYAEAPIDATRPTILVYGHYDVQPAQPAGWYGNPFSLHQQDDRLYARGVADNKGQILIHLHAVAELLQEKALHYNVKFLIEGNEESGNPDLRGILADEQKLLACDHILISDGQIVGDTPTIEAGLRGGFNCTISYKTAPSNLHSGLYGGIVPNAAHELSKLVASLHDKDGRVQVAGFYDDVDEIPDDIRADLEELANKKEGLKDELGVGKICALPGNDYLTQTGLVPCLQVTGLSSGYFEEGYMNIVPGSAKAKVNVRTVASQSAQQVREKLRAHVEAHTPDYVSVSFEGEGFGDAVKLDHDGPVFESIKKNLEAAFGVAPKKVFCGGGIPVVADFKDVFGKASLLVPLANEDCVMHGVNENFSLKQIERGIKFSRLFFSGA